MAVFDRHISLREPVNFAWRGQTYWGKFVKEHAAAASAPDVEASLWYSLDNRRSFNFTRDSLCNLLKHVGFTSVLECMVPYEVHHADWPIADWTNKDRLTEYKDRITLIAVKGERIPLLTSPVTASQPELDRFERSKVDGPLERSGRQVGRVLDRLLNRFPRRKISGGLIRLTRPIWPKTQD